MTTEYPTADEWAERMSDALLKPLREVGAMLAREVDAINDDVRELRRDVADLGRKVENLAALAGDGEREHSVRVGPPVRLAPLVVVDMEAAIPTVVGTHVATVEDGVSYLDREGRRHVAPADCVRVVRRDELPELRRKAAQP